MSTESHTIIGEYIGTRDDGGHRILTRGVSHCYRGLYPLEEDVLSEVPIGSQVSLTLIQGDGTQGSIFLIGRHRYEQRSGICT